MGKKSKGSGKPPLPPAHPEGRGYTTGCACADCKAHRARLMRESRARKKLREAEETKPPKLAIVADLPPRDTSNDDEWEPPKPPTSDRKGGEVEESVRADFAVIRKERDGAPFLASLEATALKLAREIDESGEVDVDGKALGSATQAAAKLLDIVKHLAPAEAPAKDELSRMMAEMAAPLVPPKPPVSSS